MTETLKDGREIVGYCPRCGSPILVGALVKGNDGNSQATIDSDPYHTCDCWKAKDTDKQPASETEDVLKKAQDEAEKTNKYTPWPAPWGQWQSYRWNPHDTWPWGTWIVYC